jgi:hypothetical protein
MTRIGGICSDGFAFSDPLNDRRKCRLRRRHFLYRMTDVSGFCEFITRGFRRAAALSNVDHF